MVKKIKLLVDDQLRNKKKGDTIKVYADVAKTLVAQNKAEYVIIKEQNKKEEIK